MRSNDSGQDRNEQDMDRVTNPWPMVIGVLALVVVGFLAWRGMSSEPSAPSDRTSTTSAVSDQPLKLSFHSWIGNGIYFVAQEKGFFTKEGLTVELQQVDDAAVSKQLLSSGQVDGIMGWTPETIQVLANADVDVKVVLASDVSDGADGVIGDASIQTIEDLKGKSVAYEPSSPSHFFLSYLLDQAGMTTDDVESVNQTAADAGASFVAGKVDAAVTWEPWLSQASERDGGHTIVSSKNLPILPALPAFRSEVVAERRADVQAYMRGLFATMQYIDENPDEAYAIIAKGFNLTLEDVQSQIPTFDWLDYDQNLDYFAEASDDSSVYNVLGQAGALWLKQGLIEKQANLDETIDATLLQDLYN